MLLPTSREEITLPWLTAALAPHEFTILSHAWEVGTQVGNGVGALSSLERLSLTILRDGEERPEVLNLIVKSPPPMSNPDLRSFVLNQGFCEREYLMYTKIFPSWTKFQNSRSIPSKYRFRHPKLYYASESKANSSSPYNMILILEDLSSSFTPWAPGYKKGLRWTEAKKVLRELALFHAVGMAYKESLSLKHYTESFLHSSIRDEGLLSYFLQGGLNSTVNLLKTQSPRDVPSGLLQDLEAFNEPLKLQDLAYSLPIERGRKGTILHQDLHVHNLMFSKESSQVALLDFQGCSYGNPMSDLSFFLLLNCDPALYTVPENLNSVLGYYMKVYNETLEVHDEEGHYEMDELYEDYHASLFPSLIHIVMGAPNWCFGDHTGPETPKRYKTALLDVYDRCGGRLGVEVLEEFCEYFENGGSRSEE